MRFSDINEAKSAHRAGPLPPQPLYHGTLSKIDEAWLPLTHFGSMAAALDRALVLSKNYSHKYPVRLYEVKLSISHPLLTPDRKRLHHDPRDIMDMLLKMGICDDQRRRDYNRSFMIPAVGDAARKAAFIVQTLGDTGYDGFVYRNKTEDAGSYSWMNLLSEQVQTIGSRVMSFEDATALRDLRDSV